MLKMSNIHKVYKTGHVEFRALKGINIEIKDNEYVSIMGTSGSGKSTLMNIMGCLDVPSEGDYVFDDRPVRNLTPNQLAEIRNRKVGFVFQAFNLLPYATAAENVEIPLLFAGMKSKARRLRVTEVLSSVGLADKMDNKPTELSGGEMQRVAIARALANRPNLILADEPTGNLDSASGTEIIKLLDEMHAQGHTIIIITHDQSIGNHTQRIIKLKDGMVFNGNGSPA